MTYDFPFLFFRRRQILGGLENIVLNKTLWEVRDMQDQVKGRNKIDAELMPGIAPFVQKLLTRNQNLRSTYKLFMA